MEKKIIGIAIYRPEDWERLLEISYDRDQLEDTWFEWNDSVHKFENDLQQRGIKYEKILIDLNELIEYCKRQGLRIDGRSRSRFTAVKLSRLYRKK